MEPAVAVGTKFMQEVNSAAILAQLRAAGRISVSALAQRTGLSRQAVSRSLTLLESAGYAEITGPDREASTSGRPPQMVRFRAEAGHAVGIDVNPHGIRVIVADLAGETVADSRTTVTRGSGAPIGTLVRDLVAETLAGIQVTADKVWHVSVATPGIVDPGTGIVTLIPSMPEAAGNALVGELGELVSCPIYLDNDVKLATQGERWRGEPRKEDALVFIDWGERIGAGIVLHGELYRGASNDAGDIGYLDLVVDPTHAPTADSELGPFERWTGTGELLAIASAARPSGQGEMTLAELNDAAQRGEEWALSSVHTVAGRFAKGIAALRALLDPEVVVIGGDMAVLGSVMLDALEEALSNGPLRPPRLEISRLGSEAIAQGAIRHSLSAIERERFESPSARRE
jgi:predicted NBD/HSP70 family sugar kinase